MIRSKRRSTEIHPAWVRITHWLNVLAMFIMFTSGWRIYDASPLFKHLRFPSTLTLGGWLGGALLWHFAAMWLLAANFLIYVFVGLAAGHFSRRMLPIRRRDLARDIARALHGKLHHTNLSRYNAIQKVAYLAVAACTGLVLLSGLALWKPVQLLPLSLLLGGYDATRIVHFVAMTLLAWFVAVHIVMVIIVPRSLPAMLRGH
jgi:thiosulfate reductase cytochrome b subunit